MRARLIVLTGAGIGKEVAVAGPTILGRLPSCGLPIEGNAVSREHAKVFAKDGHYFVADLNSHNGTKVNGAKVTRHELCDGDEIQLGDQRVRFKLDSEADAVPDELFGSPGPAEPGGVPEEFIATDTIPPPPPIGTELRLRAADVAPRGPAATDVAPRYSAGATAEPATAPGASEVALRSPSPQGAAKAPATGAPPAGSTGGEPTIARRDRVLQYHKVADRGGLLGEDLGQRGLMFKLGALVVLLAIAAAIFWAVMSFVGSGGGHARGDGEATPQEQPK